MVPCEEARALTVGHTGVLRLTAVERVSVFRISCQIAKGNCKQSISTGRRQSPADDDIRAFA